MGVFTVVIIVALIILAVVALKMLVGIARTVISIALLILAAGLLFSFLTGNDLFGITALVSSLLP